MSPNETLLDVRGLRVDYVSGESPVRAVNGISFTIGAGEVFGLAGESGSGKSTAAMAIMRLLGPPAMISGGQVLFKGRDILTLNDEQLRQMRWNDISMVFQSAMNALNPVRRIGDQIVDVIVNHEKMAKSDARDRAAGLLRSVGIDPSRVSSYPHELSGGMRQRAVIAVALALSPSLIIMDEPTTALDVVVQREFRDQIRELQRKLGFSILFITHDMSLLVELSDQIGIMYAGDIVEIARSRDIFERPAHPYSRGLMNSFPSLEGEIMRLSGIPGSPPDIARPPSGCRFHPRCPYAMPICQEQIPRFTVVSGDHKASCHLVEQQVRAEADRALAN